MYQMLETTDNPVYSASFAYVDLMTPTVVTLMGVDLYFTLALTQVPYSISP